MAKFVAGECFGVKEGLSGMPGNRDKRNYGIVCKTDGALLFAVDLEYFMERITKSELQSYEFITHDCELKEQRFAKRVQQFSKIQENWKNQKQNFCLTQNDTKQKYEHLLSKKYQKIHHNYEQRKSSYLQLSTGQQFRNSQQQIKNTNDSEIYYSPKSPTFKPQTQISFLAKQMPKFKKLSIKIPSKNLSLLSSPKLPCGQLKQINQKQKPKPSVSVEISPFLNEKQLESNYKKSIENNNNNSGEYNSENSFNEET